MLNNFPAAARSGRYIWRHNSILYAMCHYLPEFENARFKLFADLIGLKSSTELFNRLIPDIALAKNDKLIVIELTCCFETNFAKSRKYKISRYENKKKTVRTLNGLPTKIIVEESSQGFVPKDLNRFKKTVQNNQFNKHAQTREQNE